MDWISLSNFWYTRHIYIYIYINPLHFRILVHILIWLIFTYHRFKLSFQPAIRLLLGISRLEPKTPPSSVALGIQKGQFEINVLHMHAVFFHIFVFFFFLGFVCVCLFIKKYNDRCAGTCGWLANPKLHYSFECLGRFITKKINVGKDENDFRPSKQIKFWL